MKKFIINEEVCKKAGLDMHLLWTLLLLDTNTDFNENINTLLNKGILIKEDTLLGPKYLITSEWADKIANILYDSKNAAPSNLEERIDKLIPKLKEIFPQGKKEGTSQCWRGNKSELTQKLKKFFKCYGSNYTDEQILEAARNYVNSFRGDYRFMRVLKYFIVKDERKLNAEGEYFVEEVSELASMLENPEDINHNADWRSTLR